MNPIQNLGQPLLVGTAGNDEFLDSYGEDSSQAFAGGLGNDVYNVDSTDYVLENAGGGSDTVVIHNYSSDVLLWNGEGWWWTTEYYGVWDDYTLDANV